MAVRKHLPKWQDSENSEYFPGNAKFNQRRLTMFANVTKYWKYSQNQASFQGAYQKILMAQKIIHLFVNLGHKLGVGKFNLQSFFGQMFGGKVV